MIFNSVDVSGSVLSLIGLQVKAGKERAKWRRERGGKVLDWLGTRRRGAVARNCVNIFIRLATET